MINFNGRNTYDNQGKGDYNKQEKGSNEKSRKKDGTRFSYLIKNIKLILDSKKEEKGQRIEDMEFLEYKEFIESHIYEWFQGSKDSIIIENNNKKLSTNLIMEILKLNGLDISRFIDDIKEYIINSPLIGSVVGEEKRFQDFKNKIFHKYPKIKNLPIEALQLGYGAQKNHYSYSLQKDIDKVLKYKFSGNVRNILEKLGFKYGYKKNQYKLILDSKEKEKKQRAENIKRIREYMRYRNFIDSNVDKWTASFVQNRYGGNPDNINVIFDLRIHILYLIENICGYIENNSTLLIKSVAGEEMKLQKIKEYMSYIGLKDLPIEALQYWYQPRRGFEPLENYYSYDEENRSYKYRFPEDVKNILIKLGFKYGYEKNQ